MGVLGVDARAWVPFAQVANLRVYCNEYIHGTVDHARIEESYASSPAKILNLTLDTRRYCMQWLVRIPH